LVGARADDEALPGVPGRKPLNPLPTAVQGRVWLGSIVAEPDAHEIDLPACFVCPYRGSTARRLVSIGAAGVAFVIDIGVTLAGDRVRWTQWALPPVIAANAAVVFLGALKRRPAAARLYMFVSIAVAMAIVVSETSELLRL
jgi:hypothetical protein